MAIYHLEAKVVSRGTGRSAVAASAYLSCTNILNDYDGVRHDYTRKKGLIWREVFLPEYAPPEWKDRGVLWNAVEENEKTKDSRLAREFVPALPVELTPTQWQELLQVFLMGNSCVYAIDMVKLRCGWFNPSDIYKIGGSVMFRFMQKQSGLSHFGFWPSPHLWTGQLKIYHVGA